VRLVQSICGPFWVWEADHLGQVLESGAFWDAHLLPLLAEAPRGWAIDLGANVGVFSRWLAQHHDHVVAVEAHPLTFEMLVKNVPEVEAWHAVAYDRAASFQLASTHTVGWPTDALASSPNASSVPFVRVFEEDPHMPRLVGVAVDTLLPLDAPVTVIKCDVQGCDLRALRGLRETITRCRPLILFEYEHQASSWHGDDWEDYVDFFERMHYAVERVRGDIWDFVARPR
jgi:FkbM family methyltransferase